MRLRRKELNDGAECFEETSLYSKFGVAGSLCSNNLILLPEVSRTPGDGTQYFDGRIGKLRYFSLAIMVATSAVSREVVQLALAFPTEDSQCDGSPLTSTTHIEEEKILRAPIVYPVLHGHVLTHVVAAMCATCGRARARNDFDSVSESLCDDVIPQDQPGVDSVLSDCVSFIKLGLLARTLQVLLGIYSDGAGNDDNESTFREHLCSKVKQSLRGLRRLASESWEKECLLVLQASLSLDSCGSSSDASSPIDLVETDTCVVEACAAAKVAAISFLSDAGLILQVLCPGASTMIARSCKEDSMSSKRGVLGDLMTHLQIESISDMIRSPLVKTVLRSWYLQSRPTETLCIPAMNVAGENNFASTIPPSVQRSLDCVRRYPTLDWPEGSSSFHNTLADTSPSLSPSVPRKSPLYTSVKKVPFFGGRCPFPPDVGTHCQRIKMLPTSYTDLYAELGALCPDSEQTAICLVCGMVSPFAS